ncbi:toprim domain-containing protein [Flavobacterium oreochromis]|uniref:Toprim domain-containing protein n=1 Tax=Flavobacterium oreochromis TaxID=2906078 RepID=A0ABW8PBU2_9FLAO|nr:toprim domain-containing protein [Flavobacterium oreochromis]OWP75190.1 hypothetical protein BWG23_11660 [Flavobacterium oreochromis]
MNATQARDISIEKVLQNLGCEMTKSNETDSWFLSPFRIEKTASFKINKKINRWFDFGEQRGGNVIDFVILKFGFSIPEALNYLNQFSDFISFHQQVFHTHDEDKIDHIEKIIPIQHPALIQYLKSRGITQHQKVNYLKQIHYSIKERKYFGLAFRNESGGFEVRSKFAKLCLGNKNISHIKNKTDKIRIFEGFFDYLTFIEIQENYKFKDSDYLILNSVGLLHKNLDIIERYTQVETFLDNDEAGDKYTQQINEKFPQAIDKRKLFSGYKDLNEWFCIMKLEVQ